MTCESFTFSLKKETLTFSEGPLSSENSNIRPHKMYFNLLYVYKMGVAVLGLSSTVRRLEQESGGNEAFITC